MAKLRVFAALLALLLLRMHAVEDDEDVDKDDAEGEENEDEKDDENENEKDDEEPDDDEPEDDIQEQLKAVFRNKGSKELDLYWRDPKMDGSVKKVDTVHAFGSSTQTTYWGHQFELIWAGEPPSTSEKAIITVEGNGEVIIHDLEDIAAHGRLLVDSQNENSTHMSKCEECLHMGMDYCISTNECVSRSSHTCDGPHDHVSGDEDFAEETGAPFLECPDPEDDELVDGHYIEVAGHISEKARTLFKQTMPMKAARLKCTETSDCVAVTVMKKPKARDEMVEVEFKAAADLIHSTARSFIYVERADELTRKEHVPRAEEVPRMGGFLGRIQSEAAPDEASLYSGHVLNLVGNTFDATAMNLEKDVIVNCFAPWCGWSQAFKPIFSDIAKSLRHVQTMQFAQIDATRNYIGGVQIDGFPSMLLFRAGENKSTVLSFPGKRTVDAIRRWLHVYATKPFSDYPPKSYQSQGSSDSAFDIDDL